MSLLLNLDLDYPVFTSLFILKTVLYLFKEKGNEGQFSNAKSQPGLFCWKFHRWLYSTLHRPGTVKYTDYCILSKASPMARSKEVRTFLLSVILGGVQSSGREKNENRKGKRKNGVDERGKLFLCCVSQN